MGKQEGWNECPQEGCVYAQYVVTLSMDFEWDEEKNLFNIEKHGISFETAKRIFERPVFTWKDTRHDYRERRELSLGTIEEEVLLTVVHTDRENAIRMISARVASQRERRIFDDAKRKNALRIKSHEG